MTDLAHICATCIQISSYEPRDHFRIHSGEHYKIHQNRPHDDPNFQFWLHHCSDDLRDLRLSFCRNLAPSIGFRGLEAQFWESSKKYQWSGKSIDFVSRHLAGRLSMFWPDCGECFAPFTRKSSSRCQGSENKVKE